MKTEKREHKRFVINQMVQIDCGREAFIPALGLNISRTGLLVDIPEVLSSNDRVYLLVSLPGINNNHHSIQLEGTIKRVAETAGGRYEAGIEISDISSFDQTLLDDFLK